MLNWLIRKLFGVIPEADLKTDLRTENRTIQGFGYKFMLFSVTRKGKTKYHWWAEPVMPYVAVFKTRPTVRAEFDEQVPLSEPSSFTLDSQGWKEFISKPFKDRATNDEITENRVFEDLVRYISNFIDARVEEQRKKITGVGVRKGIPRDDEKY